MRVCTTPPPQGDNGVLPNGFVYLPVRLVVVKTCKKVQTIFVKVKIVVDNIYKIDFIALTAAVAFDIFTNV